MEKIYNQIRGLSPYPAAWTWIRIGNEKEAIFKIYLAKEERTIHQMPCRSILSDQKTYLKIAVDGGFINLIEVQLAGKKRMPIADFLRGNKIDSLEII